jgi:hypothetical protein
MSKARDKIVLLVSIPLAALIISASCIGLFTPEFYAAETLNWQAQSVGQDLIDLVLITPCLLITSVLAYRNNKAAFLIWGGVVLYLTYTFVLYCFQVHFNKLFIVYCLCLGLAIYSLVYFLFTLGNQSIAYAGSKFSSRVIGIYFIIIAVLFYFLWLAEVVPATIRNTIPKSVSEAGLFTNGVHVLDLAIILPAIFVTGIFLLKRISVGSFLAPVILTFFILMDITIGLLAIVMKLKGVEVDLKLTGVMGALALVSMSFLIWYLKGFKTESRS